MSNAAPETPLTVIAHMRARPGKDDVLHKALASLVDLTRKEDGCVTYDLHRSLDDPGQFVMYEIWASRAHHEAHEQTPHLREFAAAAADLLDGGLRIDRLTRLDVHPGEAV